jgi:hypothetical protein
MHPLFMLGWLFPATALAVIGFFVLVVADRSAGRLRKIGNILGIWLFILAGLVIVAGAIMSAAGPGRWGMGRMGQYHDQMMRSDHPGWMQPTSTVPSAPAPATAPSAKDKK